MSEILSKSENEILQIIQTSTLNDDEISALIATGKKDILICLARHQTLNDTQIQAMIPNAVYLCLKALTKQSLNADNKEKIIQKMMTNQVLYKEILQDLKELKW
ncbi:hypothetical protein [Campylobacter majalis]|uniref:hypothetical protein n=1 Tax=Campylobacter majalis TaxID=2790656 RepID=UPI003D693851